MSIELANGRILLTTSRALMPKWSEGGEREREREREREKRGKNSANIYVQLALAQPNKAWQLLLNLPTLSVHT